MILFALGFFSGMVTGLGIVYYIVMKAYAEDRINDRYT